MSKPEIKAIRTNDVVLYELTPEAEWKPVRKAGDRLTVGLKALDVFKAREVRLAADDDAKVDMVIKYTVASVQEGTDILDVSAIPANHYATLASVAFQRSVTGADPFFVAPAES